MAHRSHSAHQLPLAFEKNLNPPVAVSRGGLRQEDAHGRQRRGVI